MWILEIIGAIIHFFLLVSIFDIYLQRELYQGLSQNCTHQPLAKRLVLILVNGLDGEEALEFIRNDSSLSQKIKFGVAEKNNLMKSNGITALTGGFEQNPRPVSTIYGYGTTEFDHIFNYASKTVYVGDLIDLNYFGESCKSWKKYTVNKNDSNNNTTMKTLLSRFEQDITKEQKNSIFQDCNLIIFVNIPAVPNPSYKRKSDEKYINNFISDLFENKINQIIQTVDRLYNDNETSFMLCSDKSENTSDEKSNELFMMWGKGVIGTGETTINMKDLSLMASTILGNPIPLSSTGTWRKSFLNLTEEESVIAFNALHLSSMANGTLQQVGNKILEVLHLNYQTDSQILEQYQMEITNLLHDNNKSEINEISEVLTTFSLKILEKDVVFMKSMMYYLTHCLFIGWTITLLIQLATFKITKHPDQEMRIQILRKKTELWFFGMHTLLILLGTTSVLFIIVKEWPMHYIFHWLISLSMWGFVLGNFQIWTGVMDNMNIQKFSIILLYTVIYGVACECFIWGLKYKLVFCGIITAVTFYNWIKCYATKKTVTLKISSIVSGMSLAAAILLLPVTTKNPVISIVTGIMLPIASVICAYYMRYNAFDFLTMTVVIFHSCISLIITSFKSFHPVKHFEVISWTLFGAGIFLPIFGGVNKLNRLQHIAVCFGSSITLLSINFEPLIVVIVIAFSIFWNLIDKPQHKTKFLNRYNSFQVVTFATLTFAIIHLMGSLDQTNNNYSITEDIFEKIKLILVLLIALTAFTALKHVNGGDSQFVMAVILLNYCSYRLFLEMEFYVKSIIFSKQLNAYCILQITMIILFVTHSFSKFILHVSIMKVKKYLGALLQRVFNITVRH